ncbi:MULTISPECIES: hypothetical protein [Haloarcula]|uniref:hypothetical protein n=1 Tax=Haloarcula TaxID=2237 RepID=UPI0023E860D3|nr:hypothetical protein [Halomicroarcula sp. SHR3]
MQLPRNKLPQVTEQYHSIAEKAYDEDLANIQRLRFFINTPELEAYGEDLLGYGYNYDGTYTQTYVFTEDSDGDLYVRRAYTMTQESEEGHDATGFSTNHKNVVTKTYDEPIWAVEESMEEMLL